MKRRRRHAARVPVYKENNERRCFDSRHTQAVCVALNSLHLETLLQQNQTKTTSRCHYQSI